MPNALAHETSPYLLQHQDNPVDWRPWSPAAFAEARERGIPVLVSIGYSACHWCHVMERESFEDAAIAAQMNRQFVCIKVDREERPDVDAIYMDAVQAMTGQGGWPLNAFLDHNGVPFHAGTYFPPEPRLNLPSWPQLLDAVSESWTERGDEIAAQASKVAERLSGGAGIRLRADAELPTAEQLDGAVAKLRETFDSERGGWGSAPKFPAPSTLEFLFGRGEHQMSLLTLYRMASGGMYDQIGGGFSRYSVDAYWLVPHFEKMLYDNALLARAYLHGYQRTGDERLRKVCEDTLRFCLRELRQPEGGFASALDADSEGVEGKFYVWTLAEVRAALPAEQAEAAIAFFGMSEQGNFEGVNVPMRALPDEPADLDEIRAALFAARSERERPGLDDKRLTSWNALMISALADAGAALGVSEYLDAAVACAEFIQRDLRDADGRLLRTFNRGQGRLAGYLEDHAHLLQAFLTLYEATFDPRWYAAAVELADVILARFHDPVDGGFFAVADDHEQLIARRKELEDHPVPGGQSAAALGLLRLARLTGERSYEDAAAGTLRLLGRIAIEHPGAFSHLLQAADFALGPVREVALVGVQIADLAAVVRSEHRPHVVLAGGPVDGGPALLADRPLVDGQAAAYVCEHFACRQPVTSPDELAALLT